MKDNTKSYEVKTCATGMSWTGLAAQAWDPSGGDKVFPDQAFIQTLIASNREPALDVGCGTGRLLLRYLAAGLDVDGIDTSADILAICRQKAKQRDLNPKLYQQAMQDLDLPRLYRLIYIPCGTFSLIIDREQVMEAFQRMFSHLLPGGLLVFNLYWPFGDHAPLSVASNEPDEVWHSMWTHTLPDGSEIAQAYKFIRVDRIEQVMYAQRRYQLLRDGQIEEEEIFAADERWYLKHEVVLLLEKAGFRDVQGTGDWTDQPFAEPQTSIVFVARK